MKKIASRFGIALVVLIGAFLVIVSIEPDLVRGKRRLPPGRDAISSFIPVLDGKKEIATITTAPLPPPAFSRPKLPRDFQRLEGARHAPDEMYAEWLESKPRIGTVPRNLSELPTDDKTQKKITEFGNQSELDYRLKFLDALGSCFDRSSLPDGAIVAALWFEVAGNVAKPVRVTYEATTLPQPALQNVQTCIHQAHVSSAGFMLKPEPGMTEHVWPTTITIPLKNHELYHWLDAE